MKHRTVPPPDLHPTPQEIELGARAKDAHLTPFDLAILFAEHREAVIKPFDEYRRDMRDIGDRRAASDLQQLIDTARGET